jgi:hypothetical protein
VFDFPVLCRPTRSDKVFYRRTNDTLYLGIDGHPDNCEIHFQDDFLSIKIDSPTALRLFGVNPVITFEIPYSLKIPLEFKFAGNFMEFDKKKFAEDLQQTLTDLYQSFQLGVDNEIVFKLSYSNVGELYRAKNFGPEQKSFLDKASCWFFRGQAACEHIASVAVFEFRFVKEGPKTYRMSEDFIFKFGPRSQNADLLARQNFRDISEIPNLKFDEAKLFSMAFIAHVFTKLRQDAPKTKQKTVFSGFRFKKW